MTRRMGLLFIIPILICACTPTHDKRPKIDFSSDTRIGLINVLESFATHTHFSSISTQRFTNTYEVDWEMPDYVDKELMKLWLTDLPLSGCTLGTYHRRLCRSTRTPPWLPCGLLRSACTPFSGLSSLPRPFPVFPAP